MKIVLFSLLQRPNNIDFADIFGTSECLRADAYRQKEDRKKFLNGRVWMRFLITRELGVPVSSLEVEERKGVAPLVSLAGQSIPFSWSLSRSGELGAMAFVQDGRVGIDIEQMSMPPESEEISKLHFSPQEQQVLREATPQEQAKTFLRLWTAKEALTKATGEGLSADWSSFSVIPENEAEICLVEGRAPYQPGSWQLSAIGNPDAYLGCVATDRQAGPISIEDLRV